FSKENKPPLKTQIKSKDEDLRDIRRKREQKDGVERTYQDKNRCKTLTRCYTGHTGWWMERCSEASNLSAVIREPIDDEAFEPFEVYPTSQQGTLESYCTSLCATPLYSSSSSSYPPPLAVRLS
ncbi:hypothetical protein KQX54_004835, partial [Cotesia glomerata]